MTPPTPTDDNWALWWLRGLYVIVGLLATLLTFTYRHLGEWYASKEWVKDLVDSEMKADTDRDRLLFHDLMAPIGAKIDALEKELARLHTENQSKLDRILFDLERRSK